jgi:hypothetical protein
MLFKFRSLLASIGGDFVSGQNILTEKHFLKTGKNKEHYFGYITFWNDKITTGDLRN